MTCIGCVTGFGLHSQDRQEASPILPDFSLVPANVLELSGSPPSQTWGLGPGRSGVGGAGRFVSPSDPKLLNLPCSTSSLNLRLTLTV